MARLFFISVSEGYGGSERNLELTVATLQAGHQITVFASNQIHLELLNKIAQGATRIVRMPAVEDRLSHWSVVGAILGRYLLKKPDAVVTNTNLSARIIAGAARIWPSLDQRCLLYVHDVQWRDKDYIFGHLPTAHLLYPSQMVPEVPGYLPRRAGTIVPCMADPPEQNESAGEGDYVLHLATINPWKGHAHLIGAAGLIKQRGAPLPVISAGFNAMPQRGEALKTQIFDAGLGETFRMLPHADDPSELLKNCHCVVITSVSHSGGPETFGRTLIEAWSHKKPVVAFACGAVASLIDHERDGLLVEEGDEAGLADAIMRLHLDPGMRRRLGIAGYEKFLSRFSTASVTQLLLESIKEDQMRRRSVSIP